MAVQHIYFLDSYGFFPVAVLDLNMDMFLLSLLQVLLMFL